MYNVFMMCLDITVPLPPAPLLLVTVEIVMIPLPPSPASSLLPIDFKCFIAARKSAACSPEPVLALLIKIENYKWKYSVSLVANKVFASSSTLDVLINILDVQLSKYVSRGIVS